jgi:Na/Pi-cotransporter
MTTFQTVAAAIAAIVLFLYGLQGFGRELRAVGGAALQSWLGRVTASRWRGFLVGALATAVVQSSSATTALAVTLVDATVITFGASLGILLGANVGTTATAWLVSFKLTGIGPVCIVLGAVLSAAPLRIAMLGKAVFYFGLIFFALDLIGQGLQPLQAHPVMQQGLAMAANPYLGVLAGLVFTALVQSSSVTTGLAIVMVQQGLLPAAAAIPVVLGANVGSTSTALVASLGMGPVARASAVSNFLFNLTGLVLYLPFLPWFSRWVVESSPEPGLAVAWAHLVFNLSIGLAFLATLRWLEPVLRLRLLPDGDPADAGRGERT